jgi:transcriptional regulator with XRE-family HTH domain
MLTIDSLAAVLRLVRDARGLRIEDFAGTVEPRHVQSLEAGRLTTTSLASLEGVAKVLGVNPITLLVLSSGFGADGSPADVLKEIQHDIKALDALKVNAESFSRQFQGGQLVSRPAGVQVNQEKLAAVLLCKDQGMSISETAKKLGMPATTVRRYWLKNES